MRLIENTKVQPSELFFGLLVIDDDGDRGVVKDCADLHNILVEYDRGGAGLHCLYPGCECFKQTLYHQH